MPVTDCDGCDCPCIEANLAYYQAAVDVSSAAKDVADAEYVADYAAWSYYYYTTFYCNCGSSMIAAKPNEKPPMDPAKLKTAMLLAREHANKMRAAMDKIATPSDAAKTQ